MAEIITRKVDENTIEITKSEVTQSVNNFTLDYLLAQKASIQAQKDRDNAQRDAELAEINTLISECVKLNITEKVIVVK